MIEYTHEQIQQALQQTLTNRQFSMSALVEDFCRRMYAAPQSDYVKRLEMAGFTNKTRVLDAGCGFGQWSLALLAAGNAHIAACDASEERTACFQSVLHHLGEKRIEVTCCQLEELPYAANSFEAVFCYSVIHCADAPRVLAELHRVLRPGGALYVTANGLGYYIQRWLEAVPRVDGHSPRIQVAQALMNTALIEAGTAKAFPVDMVIEQKDLHRLLTTAGFKSIHFAHEGCIDISGQGRRLPFFAGEFNGMTAVYECMAQKKL